MFKNYVNRAVIEQNFLHVFIYTTSWGGGKYVFDQPWMAKFCDLWLT